MIIGFNMPACTAGTPTNGSWQLASQSALFDGKPARVARATMSGAFSFAVTFASQQVHVFALLRSTLPNGTAVSFTAGGQTASGTVQNGAFYTNLANAVTATSVTVTITATGTFDIGELFVGDGMVLPLQPQFEHAIDDNTVFGDTLGFQPANVERAVRRRYTGVIQVQDTAATFTDSKNLKSLAMALTRGRKAVFIPLLSTPHTGGLVRNEALIQATAVFGFAENVGRIDHSERGYWTMGIDFVEVP